MLEKFFQNHRPFDNSFSKRYAVEHEGRKSCTVLCQVAFVLPCALNVRIQLSREDNSIFRSAADLAA